jgi:two-component system sensor histidine kinase UhpB
MQLRELVRQPDAAVKARLRGVGSLLLACIAVQLAFWLVINPLLFGSAKRPEAIAVHSVMLAAAPSPDPAGFETARFRPVELPVSDCCGPGYRLVRMQFTLPVVPPDGLALVPMLGSDNFHIRVNRQWARQDGRLDLNNPTYHGNLKTIQYISPDLLIAGSNQLEFITMRAGVPYFDMGPPILAPYGQANKLLAHRNYILNDYQVMAYSFGLLSAALALLLLWRSEQKRFGLAVFVLLAA